MGGGIKHILVAAKAAGDEFIAAAAAPIELVNGVAPTRVKILPMGEIKLRDGRGPFHLRDQAHAEEVLASTRAYLGTLDFSFDYNHAAAAGHGADARASGWCSPGDLVAEADGIYATNVAWTPAAAKMLADREYRFISPLFLAAKGSGDVVHIKNAALVNIGAIDLPAVAAGATGDENPMNLEKLLALLGLGADASEESVAAAIDTLKGSASIAAIAAAAGLAETATLEEVTAGVGALKAEKKPDMSAYVPASIADGMKAELATLRTDRLSKKVDELVAAGIVIPAKRQDTLDWFVKDEPAATKFFDGAPAVVAAGAVLGDRQRTEKKTTLTEAEVAACEMTGMSHEAFLVAANAQLEEIG